MKQYDDDAEKYGYEGEMETMKCDELKPLVFSLNDLAYVDESAVKKNFDNPHNHAVYKATEVDEAIAELKEAWRCEHEACETLKKKLADAQAGAYADSVDAGMENRRLNRALWLARAQGANDKARIYYFAETCGVKLNINGYSVKEKGHARMCTARNWMITWLKVKRKCRAKAEGYK